MSSHFFPSSISCDEGAQSLTSLVIIWCIEESGLPISAVKVSTSRFGSTWEAHLNVIIHIACPLTRRRFRKCHIPAEQVEGASVPCAFVNRRTLTQLRSTRAQGARRGAPRPLLPCARYTRVQHHEMKQIVPFGRMITARPALRLEVQLSPSIDQEVEDLPSVGVAQNASRQPPARHGQRRDGWMMPSAFRDRA